MTDATLPGGRPVPGGNGNELAATVASDFGVGIRKRRIDGFLMNLLMYFLVNFLMNLLMKSLMNFSLNFSPENKWAGLAHEE